MQAAGYGGAAILHGRNGADNLREIRPTPRSRIAIVATFIVARVACLAVGVRFDIGNLHSWWQILDVEALNSDLAGSLYHLHSQPPLFNLLIGLVLKVSEEHAPTLFTVCFSSLALVGLLAFHTLALRHSGRPCLALAVTLLLAVAPPVILYEFRLYYEGLVVWLLVIGLALLQRFFDTGRILPGLAGFGVLAVGVLTRATLHPVWFAALVLIPLVMCRGHRRAVLLATALPALLIGAVMTKNFVVFGTPALSSWGPINLARMTVDTLPPDLRARMVAQGRLTPFSGPEVFANVDTYLAVATDMGLYPHPYGVAVTDAPRKASGPLNYNHYIYLTVAKYISQDTLAAVIAYPMGFAVRVGTALYHFNRPPSAFKGLEVNQARIALWDSVYRLFANGQPAAFDAAPDDAPVWRQIGYLQVVMLIAAAIAATRILWLACFARHRLGEGAAPLLLCLAVSAALLSAVSVVFDVWENNRARHALDPLLFLLVLWLFRPPAREAP